MNNPTPHTIWTIGHSNHSLEEFLTMLNSFEIELLADVRSYPGSNYVPHFNKENLQGSLPENDIEYVHLRRLGGRRKFHPDSENTVWRNKSFRAYADYMESDDFKKGAEKLAQMGKEKRTAYMCSEAVWWRCHRSMVSDYLKSKGWNVMHIMERGEAQEHPYTSPARIVNGNLIYGSEETA
ncbi:MAG TPA: DUF488 domain-containing protein [Balneolaceae bacterium]